MCARNRYDTCTCSRASRPHWILDPFCMILDKFVMVDFVFQFKWEGQGAHMSRNTRDRNLSSISRICRRVSFPFSGKITSFFRFCFLELKAIELLISLFVLWLRIPLSYASFKQFAEKTKCIYPEMIDVEMKYGWSSTTSLNRTRHRVDFLREMATVYFR